MGPRATCCECGRAADSSEGYLRPEGFVCGSCWKIKLDDPSYVRAMERQLEGLLSTLTAASTTDGGAKADQAIPAPGSDRERRALDSLLGLAAGDALGAQWEGEDCDPRRTTQALEPTDGVALWTDDTQMALSVVEVLFQHGHVDQTRLAAAFVRRYESWRGYGAGLHALISELRKGRRWQDLTNLVFPGGSYGNGSAMRVAPLGAFFHEAPIDTVVREAERSAEVTHAHPEARAGAAAVAVASWLAARSRGKPVPAPSPLCSAVCAPLDPSLSVVQGIARAAQLSVEAGIEEAATRLGNGSRVSCQDTVPLALWVAFTHLDDLEAAIRWSVAAGGDTDTLAAIAGGIVAARVGAEGIPGGWRERLEAIPLLPRRSMEPG